MGNWACECGAKGHGDDEWMAHWPIHNGAVGQPLLTQEEHAAIRAHLGQPLLTQEEPEVTQQVETDKPGKHTLSEAMRHVDVYHGTSGIEIDCDCGTALTNYTGETTTTFTVLDLVTLTLEHRKTCSLTQE